MSRENPRSRRLNEAVAEAIAFILEEEVSDPRLELVTVTGANVTKDLSVAQVWVTAHGDETRYAQVREGLESAKGRIRSLLAARVPMRKTPELRFEIDYSVDEGMRIDAALLDVPPTLAAERVRETEVASLASSEGAGATSPEAAADSVSDDSA